MALTPSGTISLADINTALGRSSTASISFNDAQVRYLANQDSGSVNMNNMRNKYNYNGTVTVGIIDDGKNYFIGGGGGLGSVNPSTINGSSVEMGYSGTTDTGAAIVSWGGAGTGLPGSFNMRYIVNGASGSMVPYFGDRRFWQRGPGNNTPVMFSTGMVGGTYSWQFAQT